MHVIHCFLTVVCYYMYYIVCPYSSEGIVVQLKLNYVGNTCNFFSRLSWTQCIQKSQCEFSGISSVRVVRNHIKWSVIEHYDAVRSRSSVSRLSTDRYRRCVERHFQVRIRSGATTALAKATTPFEFFLLWLSAPRSTDPAHWDVDRRIGVGEHGVVVAIVGEKHRGGPSLLADGTFVLRRVRRTAEMLDRFMHAEGGRHFFS